MKASIRAPADLMDIEASALVVMAAHASAPELLNGRQQTLHNQVDDQALLAALDDAHAKARPAKSLANGSGSGSALLPCSWIGPRAEGEIEREGGG